MLEILTPAEFTTNLAAVDTRDGGREEWTGKSINCFLVKYTIRNVRRWTYPYFQDLGDSSASGKP